MSAVKWNQEDHFFRYYIDDEYVKHPGYNEVGETNDIIILYPQAVPNSNNKDGCWDVYGFTGSNYGKYSWFSGTVFEGI